MRKYSAQKAALTRAIRTGDPYRIKAECNRFFNEYEEAGVPLPDDWHRWNVAGNDAVFAIQMQRGER